jgi:protoheme IX farnesyltransferase
VAIGASLLLVAGGKTATLLGILAVLWYNGVYTYLKRITAFAAVPGALVGMLPPAIGWTTAGGVIADSRLLVTSVLFFLWQIPHFWLQILHHGEEYAKAGLPSLTEILSRRQIARMIFVWICAAVATSLMFPLYGAVTSPVVYYALVPAAFWIVLQGAHVMKADHSMGLSLLVFKHLNVYIMIVMVLLSSERVFSGRP